MPSPSRLDALASAALLLFTLLACKGASKQDAPASSSSAIAPPIPSPQASPTRAPVEAWENVPLDKLLGTYKDNEVKGDNDYKGKLIRTSGSVGEVKKDAITDQIYVTVGKGGLLEIPVAQCFAAEGEDKAAGALTRGQKVTIQGRVDGLLMNVLVRDCHLNPTAGRCEAVAKAVGGTCAPDKEHGDRNNITIPFQGKPDGLEGAVWYTPNLERYQKAVEKFSAMKGATLIISERSLSGGIFFVTIIDKGGKSPPFPEDLKAKLQAAFDAL